MCYFSRRINESEGLDPRKNDDNGGKRNISIDICFFPLYMTDKLISQSVVAATPQI